MIKDITIIFTIGIVFFLIDISTFKYCNTEVYPVLLLHHVLNIFAQFGFLVQDKKLLLLYLFAPILTILHWYTNGNKCFLTQYVNEKCNLHMRFRDIWYFLGVKNFSYYSEAHYLYLFICWIIALVRYLNL
jgi:hypothetical protein